jgi:heme exporter protein A
MQLQASRLGCVRGTRRLFGGVHVALKAGEALRVAGANGSGKSSLLRMLCGLTPPHEGDVQWQGVDIHAARAEFASTLFYLGHGTGIKDDLTAAENLSAAATLAGLRSDARTVSKALAEAGAPDGIACRLLSEGQRKRVALARLALARERPLWVLDEPFSSLDAAACVYLLDRLRAHVQGGGILVYTTHEAVALDGKVLNLDTAC